MTERACSRYTGYRLPSAIISHAMWLYFRFPLSLRMIEERLAAHGIVVSHETVRQWALKFGQDFANEIRRRLACARLRHAKSGWTHGTWDRDISTAFLHNIDRTNGLPGVC